MKYVRHIAIFGLLFCLFVIFRYTVMPDTVLSEPGNNLTTASKLIGASIFGLLFIIVIVKPKLYILLGLIMILGSLFNIYDGGNIFGLLFYTFGISIGLKSGFFRSYSKGKLALLAIIFFGVLLLQLKSGLDVFMVSFMNIGLLIALFFCFYLMFKQNLQEYFKVKEVIHLDQFHFTDRQLACIKGCLEKKSLQEIADQQIVSVSVIKKKMQKIYQAFEIEDRYDIHILLESKLLIFPKSQ